MEGIKYFRRSYDKTLKAEAYRKFEYNFVFGQMSVYDIFKKEIRPEMATFEPDPPNDVIFNQVIETQTYKDLLSNEDSQMFITSGETQPFEYNQTLDEVKERIYLIIGDERGYVKIWDLEPTLKELMR